MKKALLLLVVVGLVSAAATADTVLYREVFPNKVGYQNPTTLAWTFGFYANDSVNGVPLGQSDVEGWYGCRANSTNYAPIRYADQPSPANGTYTIVSSTNEPSAVNSNPSVQCAQCAADGRTGYLRWTQTGRTNVPLYSMEYQVAASDVTSMSFDMKLIGTDVLKDTRLIVHIGSDFDTNWFVSDQGFTNTAVGIWETATFNFASLTWGTTTKTNNATVPTPAGQVPYYAFTTPANTGSALPSGMITAFGAFCPTVNNNQRGLDNFTIMGVPEPATMSLLGLGVIGLIRRK
jgi:hypothetical protein